jgi:chromosome segregation ATPase
MNEGLNDLIDQFEVAQGVIESQNTRLTKCESDTTFKWYQEFKQREARQVSPEAILELQSKVHILDERASQLSSQVDARQSDLEELRYSLDQVDMAQRQLEESLTEGRVEAQQLIEKQASSHLLVVSERVGKLGSELNERIEGI